MHLSKDPSYKRTERRVGFSVLYFPLSTTTCTYQFYSDPHQCSRYLILLLYSHILIFNYSIAPPLPLPSCSQCSWDIRIWILELLLTLHHTSPRLFIFVSLTTHTVIEVPPHNQYMTFTFFVFFLLHPYSFYPYCIHTHFIHTKYIRLLGIGDPYSQISFLHLDIFIKEIS